MIFVYIVAAYLFISCVFYCFLFLGGDIGWIAYKLFRIGYAENMETNTIPVVRILLVLSWPGVFWGLWGK